MNDHNKRRAYLEGWDDGIRDRPAATSWGTTETYKAYCQGYDHGKSDRKRALSEADKVATQ